MRERGAAEGREPEQRGADAAATAGDAAADGAEEAAAAGRDEEREEQPGVPPRRRPARQGARGVDAQRVGARAWGEA